MLGSKDREIEYGMIPDIRLKYMVIVCVNRKKDINK